MKLFELFGKGQLVKESWAVGDKVHPKWESSGSWEPMEIVAVNRHQITVKDDHGNAHNMAPNDIVRAGMTEGGSPGQIRSTKIKHGHKYRPFKHKNKKALGKWQGDDKRDKELEEANPRMPAVRDRQEKDPAGEIGRRPTLKRQGQRAGRNLSRKYGIGNPAKNAAKAYSAYDIDESEVDEDMRAERLLRSMTPPAGVKPSSKLDLSKKRRKKRVKDTNEDASGKINTKDPRLQMMLKKARANYAGRAEDDLSALFSMMSDEQSIQDKELDSLDDYNIGQDGDINHTDHVNHDQEIEIGDLAARIDKLEQGQGQDDFADVANEAHPGRNAVLDRTHNYPTGKGGAKPSSKRQNQWIDRNLRSQYGKGGKPANAEKLYDLGEEIIPYKDTGEYWDDETGEIFRADQVEQGKGGKYQEKSYRDDTPVDAADAFGDWYSDDAGEEPELEKSAAGDNYEAISMFGDIAAGGGDPIDHLITQHGMDMEEIDELAREQGFADANEWAESYAEQYEMESIIGNSHKLNNR